MGKKSRLKRRKYQYTKDEFMLAVCGRTCQLCPANTDPTYCYDTIYKEDPKLFMRKSLNELKDIRKYLYSAGYEDLTKCPDEDLEYVIESAFCPICLSTFEPKQGTCGYIAGCVQALRKQVHSPSGKVIDLNQHRYPAKKKNLNSKWRKPKAQKRKAKYVPPTPTFFCRNSFRSEVDRIVNGTHIGQQNKGEETTGDATSTAGGET